MANGVHVKVGSTWQPVNAVGGVNRPYVNVDGTWIGCSNVHVKVGTTWSNIYTYDATAPAIASATATKLQNGKIRFTWGAITDGESGVSTAYIRAYWSDKDNISGGSGTAIHTIPSSQYSGGSYDYTIPTSLRPSPTDTRTSSIYCIVYAQDVAGNLGSKTSNSVTAKPLGTFQFSPTDSRSWYNGINNGGYYTPGWRPSEAYIAAGPINTYEGKYRAFYFHGNGPTNLCDGYEPDTLYCTIERRADYGDGNSNWWFHPHGYASKPAGEAWLDENKSIAVFVPYVSGGGTDYNYTFTAPASWKTGLASGDIKSFGANDSNPSRVYIDSHSTANANGTYRSGTMRLVFT